MHYWKKNLTTTSFDDFCIIGDIARIANAV